MSNEIIVFTHTDLDALGSMLNIEYAMPDIKKKYFHTNYSNIPERVDEIIDYKTKNNINRIIIPDVAFGDNKEHLKTLYDNFELVIHIDHHLYSEGFWDDFPRMKVQWDKSKSATKICNLYFRNAGKNERLDRLTRLIDVYDIWQKDEPEFMVSQDLNEYFWQYDIGELCKTIVENDYRLPSDFIQVTTAIKEQYTREIQSFEDRKLIHRADGITLCFIDDWFNQVMLKEHQDGQEFVVGINSYGIVRVRINQDTKRTEEQLDNIRIALAGTKDIGHKHVLTYRAKNPNGLENLMAEANKIVNVINDPSCGG